MAATPAPREWPTNTKSHCAVPYEQIPQQTTATNSRRCHSLARCTSWIKLILKIQLNTEARPLSRACNTALNQS